MIAYIFKPRSLFAFFIMFAFLFFSSLQGNGTEIEAAIKVKQASGDQHKQVFENHIESLLRLSFDDKMRGRNGETSEDINLRKSFFSDSAWQEYKKYVAEHKEILKSKKGELEYPQVNVNFTDETQKYDESSKPYKFSVKGHFCYGGGGCMYTCTKPQFILNVAIVGDFSKPTEMKIEEWNLDFGEELNNGRPD